MNISKSLLKRNDTKKKVALKNTILKKSSLSNGKKIAYRLIDAWHEESNEFKSNL